jgi:hypothetical protein
MGGAQGIHIVFIVIPQFLVTILCAVVFYMFPPPAHQNGLRVSEGSSEKFSDRPNSVVYIFRCVLWDACSVFIFGVNIVMTLVHQ